MDNQLDLVRLQGYLVEGRQGIDFLIDVTVAWPEQVCQALAKLLLTHVRGCVPDVLLNLRDKVLGVAEHEFAARHRVQVVGPFLENIDGLLEPCHVAPGLSKVFRNLCSVQPDGRIYGRAERGKEEQPGGVLSVSSSVCVNPLRCGVSVGVLNVLGDRSFKTAVDLCDFALHALIEQIKVLSAHQAMALRLSGLPQPLHHEPDYADQGACLLKGCVLFHPRVEVADGGMERVCVDEALPDVRRDISDQPHLLRLVQCLGVSFGHLCHLFAGRQTGKKPLAQDAVELVGAEVDRCQGCRDAVGLVVGVFEGVQGNGAALVGSAGEVGEDDAHVGQLVVLHGLEEVAQCDRRQGVE